MTTKEIEKVLTDYYNNSMYFFMTGVKNWASFSTNALLILDGVAVLKSWVKHKVIGYEIKVSRADFLKDEKRMFYQQYVTDFYFICPEWLIKKEELPANVWLVYCSDNWMKIVKKAMYMNNPLSADMMKYMVICRMEQYQNKTFSYRTVIEDYVKDKISWKELAKKFYTKITQEKWTIEKELERCNYELDRYKKIVDKVVQKLQSYDTYNRYPHLLGSSRETWQTFVECIEYLMISRFKTATDMEKQDETKKAISQIIYDINAQNDRLKTIYKSL